MARPPLLDRVRIIDTAMAIADRSGLGAVTMAAVAEALEVSPMALYRWVESKAALVDGLVERLLTEFPPPPPELPWADRLIYTASEVRRVGQRHPAVFPLLLQLPATTPDARRTRDSVRTALTDTDLSSTDAERMERMISTAVLGFVVSEVSGRFRALDAQARDNDFAWLLTMLAQWIDSAARPH